MAEENSNFGKILTEWQVAEYEKYRRTFLWYLIMGGGSLGLLIYSLWTLNFLFAIIIVIIAVVIIIHEKREPDLLNFKITTRGIQLEENYLPYKEIKKFWIIYEPPEVKNLYFETNRTLRPELSIPLINMNPIYIRNILLKYLKEDLEKKDISFDDQVGRILKI